MVGKDVENILVLSNTLQGTNVGYIFLETVLGFDIEDVSTCVCVNQ